MKKYFKELVEDINIALEELITSFMEWGSSKNEV